MVMIDVISPIGIIPIFILRQRMLNAYSAAVIDATIDLQCGMDNSEHVNMQGEHFEHTPEMYATQNNVCVRGVFQISVRRGDRSHWRRGLAPAQKKNHFCTQSDNCGSVGTFCCRY